MKNLFLITSGLAFIFMTQPVSAQLQSYFLGVGVTAMTDMAGTAWSDSHYPEMRVSLDGDLILGNAADQLLLGSHVAWRPKDFDVFVRFGLNASGSREVNETTDGDFFLGFAGGLGERHGLVVASGMFGVTYLNPTVVLSLNAGVQYYAKQFDPVEQRLVKNSRSTFQVLINANVAPFRIFIKTK